MVENTSGLRPSGVAILVEPYEPEIQQSMIVIPDAVRDRTKMIEMRAVVIAIGPEAWSGERFPRAKVGDKVLIAKFAGVMLTGVLDGKTYRAVNDRDIFMTIVEEKQ